MRHRPVACVNEVLLYSLLDDEATGSSLRRGCVITLAKPVCQSFAHTLTSIGLALVRGLFG